MGQQAELANLNVSEDLQKKLMKQMDKDRSAMEHMLEEQRHRQAEAMRARLAERRIKRKKNQKARHAIEQSEEQAIADHQKRLDEFIVDNKKNTMNYTTSSITKKR